MRPLSAVDENIDDNQNLGRNIMIDLSLIWVGIIGLGVFFGHGWF